MLEDYVTGRNATMVIGGLHVLGDLHLMVDITIDAIRNLPDLTRVYYNRVRHRVDTEEVTKQTDKFMESLCSTAVRSMKRHWLPWQVAAASTTLLYGAYYIFR